MAFNSLTFAIFLFITYTLYWSLRRPAQNALIVVASYVFYGFWDWRFLSLIAVSTVVDYCAALRIVAAPTLRSRRMWLGLSLFTNLGLLFFFKYFDFFSGSLAYLLGTLGWTIHPLILHIILPAGISFYTFQTLSYTVDCYRGTMQPARDPIAFAAFVSFFPQLVAGPIERASHQLPQFVRDRSFSWEQAADGCRQALYGVLIKTVVADNIALTVDAVYAKNASPSALDWIVGTYAFAFQIYCDFAGYSHVAIGTARLFGIDLRRNFATPYFSASLREFWTRWHISLSTWFRDYVYIPMGGNRVGPVRQRVNLLITFVVSGLWHGATITFVLWGLFHGILMVIESVVQRAGREARAARALRTFLTFQLVCVGWVLFRSVDVAQAWLAFGTMFGAAAGDWSLRVLGARRVLLHAALISLVVCVELLQREQPHALRVQTWRRGTRWALYYAAAAMIVVLGRIDEVPFIYFQF
jgi:D-alanyl-lipoteichoic acid acyltransferase DltB (MBOAT superfamily)